MQGDSIFSFTSGPQLGESFEIVVDPRSVDASAPLSHVEISWEEPEQRFGATEADALLVPDESGLLRGTGSLPGGPLPYEGKRFRVRWYIELFDAHGVVVHEEALDPAMPTRQASGYVVSPVRTEIRELAFDSNDHVAVILAGLFIGGTTAVGWVVTGFAYPPPFLVGITIGLALMGWGGWPMLRRRRLFHDIHVELDPVILVDGLARIRGSFVPNFGPVAQLTAVLKVAEFHTDDGSFYTSIVWQTDPVAEERFQCAPGSPVAFDVAMLVGAGAVPCQLVREYGVRATLEITLGSPERQSYAEREVLITPFASSTGAVELVAASEKKGWLTPFQAAVLSFVFLSTYVFGVTDRIDDWIESPFSNEVVTRIEFDKSPETRQRYRSAWEASCGADETTCRRAFNSFHGECFYGSNDNPIPTPSVDAYVRCIQRSWNAE